MMATMTPMVGWRSMLRKAVVLFAGSIAFMPVTGGAHDDAQKHTHLTMTNQPRTAMTWYRDIVYDATYKKDPDRVSLDLYVPDPVREKMPVVLFVHGGGFRSSDKAYYKDLGSKPDWLTRDIGAIFVPMNFRFLPDGGYPNSVQDVANALAWLHDNIAKYGGDPSRIVLFAHATGILSAGLVATDEQFLAKAGKSLDILKGFIGVDGAFFDNTNPGGGVRNVFASTDAALLRNGSPIHQIARGKHIPPSLILYGGQGGDVGPQSQAFAAAMRDKGFKATAFEMPSKDHFTVNEHIGVPGDETTIVVTRFLEEIGVAAKPVTPAPAAR
jgi:acetyl esterase/lipase